MWRIAAHPHHVSKKKLSQKIFSYLYHIEINLTSASEEEGGSQDHWKLIIFSTICNIYTCKWRPKTYISVIDDDSCKALAHPHLLSNDKFGYKAERYIPISKQVFKPVFTEIQIQFFHSD